MAVNSIFNYLISTTMKKNTLWCIALLGLIFCHTQSMAQSIVSKYRYWFDEDFQTNKSASLTSPDTNISLETTISTSDLKEGLHSVNFQFQSTEGIWSTISREYIFILKTGNLIGYQYWFDDNLASAPIVSIVGDKDYELNIPLSINNLSEGLHTFNARYKDDKGVWSVPVTEYLYVQKTQNISGYRYWFNSDISNAEIVSVNPPTKDYPLNLDINENKLPKTLQDTLYFQFKDLNGKWSVPVSTTLKLCGADGITNTNIYNLNPNINKPTYEVMESATIHHYFQITSCNRKPIRDVNLFYKLSHLPNRVFSSTFSDSRGILDLNIELAGISKEGDNITVSFLNSSVGATTIFGNDFDPFAVKIIKYKADKIVFGGFITGNVEIEGCAGCLQYGPLGAKAIALSAGVGAGLALNLSKDINNNFGIQVVSDLNKSIGLTVGKANAAQTVKVEFLKGKLEQKDQLRLNNLKLKETNDYIFALSLLANQLAGGEKQWYDPRKYLSPGEVWHIVSLAIRQYLGDYTPNFDYGTSQGYTGSLSAGIDFSLVKKMPILQSVSFLKKSLSFKTGITGKLGFETGTDFYNLKSNTNRTTEDYLRFFSGYDFTPFEAEILGKDIGGTRSHENYHEQRTKYLLNEPIEAKVIAGKQESKKLTLLGKSYEVDVASTHEYTIGLNAMKKLSTDIKNKTFENYIGRNLTGIGNPIAGTFGAVISSSVGEEFKNMRSYLHSVYQPTWQSGELFWHDSREYTHTASQNYGFEFGLGVGLGASLNASLDIGLTTTLKYPVIEKVYHPQAVKYLVTKDLPENEALIEIPTHIFNEFYDKIYSAFKSVGKTIMDKALGVGGFLLKNTTKVITGTGSFVLTNSKRIFSGFLKDNKQILQTRGSAEKFSTLTFTVPGNADCFPLNTDITFLHYYPAGEVKGQLFNKDTFVIISDVFFFNATNGNDTLRKAPNGNFTIEAILAKEDLDYLGLSDERISLLYRSDTSSVWQALAPLSIANNKAILPFNDMGVFAIGRVLSRDTTPPSITFKLPTRKISRQDSLEIEIRDSLSGVKWGSIVIQGDEKFIPFKRIEGTSKIKIAFKDFPDSLGSEILFMVSGYDLAGNYAYEIFSLTVTTETKEYEPHIALLSLAPNPTDDVLQILFNPLKSGKVEFLVSDIYGRIVHNTTQIIVNDIQSVTLNIQNLTNGTYLLLIKQDGRIWDTRKFVKM
jgi:hypothetical protein